MQNVEMVATKSGFHYGGRDRSQGEHFEATPAHARLLKIVGNAEEASKTPPQPKQKRRYNRRDMRAAG